MLDIIVTNLLRDLLDNVNDADLRHWLDNHHRTSPISEPVLAKDPTFQQGFLGQQYAYLRSKHPSVSEH